MDITLPSQDTVSIWLMAGASCIVFVEAIRRLGTFSRIERLSHASLRATKVLSSRRISDHWKERALPRYAGTIMGLSLQLLAILLAAASPFLLAPVIGGAMGEQMLEAVASPLGIVLCTIIAAGYVSLTTRRKPEASADDHGYGAGARLLHQMTMGNPMVSEISFDLERALYRRSMPDVASGTHVFISGLARSGSTVLMRQLYETGCFTSLTYRNAPLLLAPNLWRTLTGRSRRKGEAHQRAHGDQLEVDFDDPEALEELFWRTFTGNDYIRPTTLVPSDVNEETRQRFRDYVGCILRAAPPERRRYLSKNNNNILRLGGLHAALPRSVVLIPFREPRQQALSLMRQHERFTAMQRGDAFVREYMGWLVHHEFGIDQRPFVFDDRPPSDAPRTSLTYWLALWLAVYEHILAQRPENTLLVGYERFCATPERVWSALRERLDLPEGNPPIAMRAEVRTIDEEGIPAPLLRRVDECYGAMNDRSL